MGQALNKKILIAGELFSAPVGIFFQNAGFELHSDYNEKFDYEFIVDDFLPELIRFPRVQTKGTIADACLPQVRAYIEEKFLTFEESKKLLSQYYADFNDFNLVDHYSSQYKNIYTIKIQDYLNIGYFIDTIVVEAFKNNFDHESIRTYLNMAIPEALKIVEKQANPLHVDASFSFTDDAFAVSISFGASATAFKRDLGSVKKSAEFTNFYDLIFFKKRERASYSALWFKKADLKNAHAYFFTEVTNQIASDVSLSGLHPVEGPDQAVKYEPRKISGNNLDDRVDEIQHVLGQNSLDDVDEIFRIKGTGSNLDEESTTVSGLKENLDEEEWKVKHLEMVDQNDQQVTVIKSQGKNVIEEDILRVRSNQLQADPDNFKIVVKGILEEAPTSDLMQTEKLEDANARNFTTVKSLVANDVVKEKMESQIVKMKKLMEQMRNEMIRLKTENTLLAKNTSDQLDSGDSSEVANLKRALEKTLDLLKNKEKVSEKLKNDLESIVQAKNDKIASLEMRIEAIKKEFASSPEFVNEEKLEKLQVENKSLLARLELSNRKINIINDNMEKQDSDSNLKKDKEIITLKTHIQSAKGVIEKMKSEKLELEKNLREEKEKTPKIREEKPIDLKGKVAEQESLISALTTDKRNLEDKLKLQSIELKKIEQKMKFTTAQLEEAQKKKGTGASGAKSSEAYIKQLELANTRLVEASGDLTERKKEIHKLKQENALSNSKIAELERKLANAEKKAA